MPLSIPVNGVPAGSGAGDIGEAGVVASMPRFSPFSIEAMGNVYGPRRTPSTENRRREVIA